jgi:hypothetical protein
MKVGLLWNDNNKQESLISEGVVMIWTILHLAREHPNNTTHARSWRPNMWPMFTVTIKESSRAHLTLVHVFHVMSRRASMGGPHTNTMYILEVW